MKAVARTPGVTKAVIALGGNGSSTFYDVASLVLKSGRELAKSINNSLTLSRIFQTPAFPAGSGPDFANAVAVVETRRGAQELLEILHRIEAEAGRRREARWGPRVLDLDLVAFGEEVLPDRLVWQHWRDLPLEAQMQEAPDQLILPHPRVQDRPFVLVPLKDVWPEWTHPVTGAGIDEMLAQCDPADIAAVRPLE